MLTSCCLCDCSPVQQEKGYSSLQDEAVKIDLQHLARCWSPSNEDTHLPWRQLFTHCCLWCFCGQRCILSLLCFHGVMTA